MHGQQNIKNNTECFATVLSWQITVAGISKTGLRSSCKVTLFLSDLNQICSFWTNSHEVPDYHISWQSVQWEPRRRVRTDGHQSERV